MKGYPDIYWSEQCKYCKRPFNEECRRNKVFMEKLNSMYHEYLGTVDFVCDYFQVDQERLDQDKYKEIECNSPSI